MQDDPAAQVKQLVRPPVEYSPEPQRVGEASVVGHSYPAGQVVHDVDLAREYSPAEQAVGARLKIKNFF